MRVREPYELAEELRSRASAQAVRRGGRFRTARSSSPKWPRHPRRDGVRQKGNDGRRRWHAGRPRLRKAQGRDYFLPVSPQRLLLLIMHQVDGELIHAKRRQL